MASDLHPSRMAIVGAVVVALTAAGCSHAQTKGQGDTVTNEPQPTTTTTAPTTAPTGVKPAKKGRECVLAEDGENDPMRALNECRDTLARFYGEKSSNFGEAWTAAEALASCLTYTGVEECLAAG